MLRFVVLAVIVSAIGVCAGCATIDVEAQQWGAIDASGYRTWDWMDATAQDTRAPIDEVRAAVEQELSARGLQRAGWPEADLLFDLSFSVREQIRQQDPYFNIYPVERYELGTLTIEVFDPRSGELLWSGSGQSQLRVSGIPASPISKRLADTEAPRKWKISRKVPEILEQLPPELFRAGVAGGR